MNETTTPPADLRIKGPFDELAHLRIMKILKLLKLAIDGTKEHRRQIARMILTTDASVSGSLERAQHFQTAFEVVERALYGDTKTLSEWAGLAPKPAEE